MRNFVVALALLCAFSTSALATTYYVDPNGSDSNPGTSGSPFATPNKASGVVVAGDTVIINDGVYLSAGGGTIIHAEISGTAQSPITFRAAHPCSGGISCSTQFSGQNEVTAYAIDCAAMTNYIFFQGFEIFGFNNFGVVLSNCANVTLQNNVIHDIGRICTDTTGGLDAIYGTAVNNATINANRIYNIGRFAPGENGCFPGTNLYQNHDHGVYANGWNNCLIENNIFDFSAIARGWAIQLYSSGALTGTGCIIAHNTFNGANPWRDGLLIIDQNLVNYAIDNNLFNGQVNCGLVFGMDGYTLSGVTASNNMATAAAVNCTSSAGATFTGSVASVTPGLIVPSYRIRINSPAAFAGIPEPSVGFDFGGNARSVLTPSIGAYEPAVLVR